MSNFLGSGVRSTQPSTLVGYINNFVPSPTNSVDENSSSKAKTCKTHKSSFNIISSFVEPKYLPLIYKELLQLKTMYTADRQETDKKMDNLNRKVENIEQSLSQIRGNVSSSNTEMESLFADENILTFDAAFSKKLADPVYNAKLVDTATL